jgi:hypothetical protein
MEAPEAPAPGIDTGTLDGLVSYLADRGVTIDASGSQAVTFNFFFEVASVGSRLDAAA